MLENIKEHVAKKSLVPIENLFEKKYFQVLFFFCCKCNLQMCKYCLI